MNTLQKEIENVMNEENINNMVIKCKRLDNGRIGIIINHKE